MVQVCLRIYAFQASESDLIFWRPVVTLFPPQSKQEPL